MKTERFQADWLAHINGQTVAQAIAYLRRFPQSHVLNYWQSSGDDHGVEISSDLLYQRPWTAEELAELAAQRKAGEIKRLEASLDYHRKQLPYREAAGMTGRVAMHKREIERITKGLEELAQ